MDELGHENRVIEVSKNQAASDVAYPPIFKASTP